MCFVAANIVVVVVVVVFVVFVFVVVVVVVFVVVFVFVVVIVVVVDCNEEHSRQVPSDVVVDVGDGGDDDDAAEGLGTRLCLLN